MFGYNTTPALDSHIRFLVAKPEALRTDVIANKNTVFHVWVPRDVVLTASKGCRLSHQCSQDQI